MMTVDDDNLVDATKGTVARSTFTDEGARPIDTHLNIVITITGAFINICIYIIRSSPAD